jgi:hypothetical protein
MSVLFVLCRLSFASKHVSLYIFVVLYLLVVDVVWNRCFNVLLV